MKILVVDDNENITKLLQKYLQFKGHNCIVVSDGKTALSVISVDKFDSIILDLAMPKFTGIDFIEAMCKNGKILENKIIVLTASNILTESEEKSLIEKGVKAVIRKPMKLDTIMQILEN